LDSNPLTDASRGGKFVMKSEALLVTISIGGASSLPTRSTSWRRVEDRSALVKEEDEKE
jgi:hypothetical protein